MVSTRVLGAIAAANFAALPAPALAACDDLLPPPRAAAAKRPVTPDDLVGLRDIGQPDGAMFGQPSPLGVSPGGTKAAFILSRADPKTNSYCRALVVIDLSGSEGPRILDRGGEMITNTTLARGLVVDVGFPAIVTPAWSSDGRWIAYLRRDHGVTQVWRARADGRGAWRVTRSEVDVKTLAWSGEGKRLVFVSQPGQAEAADKVAREGRGGWLYDARFAPNYAMRPLLPDTPRRAFSIDPESGEVRSASAAEKALVAMEDQSGASIAPQAAAPGGRRALTERSGASPLAPLRLVVEERGGERIVCSAKACDGGFTAMWWDREGRDLIFLRREGWAKGRMGLYRWRPGEAAAPRAILRTGNVLLGCVMAGTSLLCTSENATTPRHLVMIDPDTGETRRAFDPNLQFRDIALGKVERLHWKNDVGLEARGDLVLPPGYRPGVRLPMIVVQYHSDGFLRGGTGDEYPIHAFAARGFAVLSIERAPFVAASRPGIRSWADVNAANLEDWAERRSLLSSLETGIGMVVDRGIADPARIGITGLSDGSSSARFALINTDLFAAAAISTCCMEPQSITTYGGIAYAETMEAMGFPPASRDSPDFWRPYSMALNASRMDVPLLMQLADEETLLALQTFTALREAGQPVEMHVFPGEHHIKWQPAHRRAIYERNLDWFAFWLQGRRDTDPGKAAQYRRWQVLREARRERPSHS
ncbi:hypothetical protein GCM10011494_24550 [Novosphingobium endophyticum]|uniref:Peptidase S9 prolyl oligopeptidase catalytic domain-containing protein n=1 Tax=Novosphingobium endophyticum TaxID=1955250 RepID=A0A916X521_9SPHN|nr:Atxe2 family lasso peptide isopeptidase [Novosphingobium endophyticum]GGC05070.1 hypothetical protein GCM10011494_24550 [Novosphingobium endophyticum]